MAVVKTTKTRFEGNELVVRVKFSSRTGRFSITVPTAVKRAMGVDEVGSDTLEDVEREYKRTLKEYRESQTTERKVIAYKVEANAWVFRRRDGTPGSVHDEDATVLFEARDISFADGCGLTLYATVMIERTLQPEHGEPHVSYEKVEDTGLPRSLDRSDHGVVHGYGADEGTQIIDWTPEREAWFAQVGRQLEDMVINVCKTLGDAKKAVRLMDSGRLLMSPESR